MKQTETEIEYEEVEHEVERIYCDECGNETTDNYVIEPQHVCRDCRTEPWYHSMRQMPETNADVSDEGIGFWIFTVLIYPIWVFATMMDAADGDDVTAAWIYMSGTIGTIVWGGLLLLIVSVL